MLKFFDAALFKPKILLIVGDLKKKDFADSRCEGNLLSAHFTKREYIWDAMNKTPWKGQSFQKKTKLIIEVSVAIPTEMKLCQNMPG